MSYFGIDISEHNGSIDWTTLAKSVDFVIVRVGWVGNKNNHTIDRKFGEYYQKAKSAGIKIGAYVYMYSNSETTAKEGAEWTLKQLAGKKFDLPIYCDMEDNSIAKLGKTKLSAITRAFNNVIEAKGYWAGIYANKNWFDNYLETSIPQRYTSWIAHYTKGTDKYKGEYVMWQNSSDGNVNGISGRVDTNYLYEDLFKKIAEKDSSKTEDTKPSTPSTSKPVTTTPSTSVRNYVTPVKWQNGSTKEPVYKKSNLTEEIGTIFAKSDAQCYGKSGNGYIVVYDLDGTSKHKAGFVDYAGKVSKVPTGGKTWTNGSTNETVYADTAKKTKVGTIYPKTQTPCLAKIDGMYLVIYTVTGTNTKKCGFVDYAGGIK